MAFHHVPTFLRSALVRNPFCHGDIISVEDVLRLESQYPNLFDKPDISSGVNTKDVPQAIKSEEQLKAILDEKVKATGLIRKGSQKVVKAVALLPSQKKSAPSQYHRNCLSSVKAGEEQKAKPIPRRRINVPPKPAHAFPIPSFTSMPMRNRKLSRPAQSFSLEDLRETLRQVMRDDALYNKPTQNPSPYTEDLVKKFLGRKLQSGHSQKRGKSSNYYKGDIKLKGFSGDESEIYGQGDSGRAAEQFGQRNSRDSHDETGSLSTIVETKLSPRRPLVQPTKEKVKRVKSAPGFIRSFPQPPVVYLRGSSSTMQKRDEKRQVTWDNKGKEGNEEKGVRKHGARLNNKDESHDKCTQKSEAEMQNDGIKPTSATRGTQIHIRSINLKKETEKQTEPHQQPVEPILPTSSFRHLLAARSITSRYKMKGLLRKQDAEFCKTNERQRSAISSGDHKDAISHEMRKTSHSSTTKVLEKIAKELVYTEILLQLRELKQQQTKAEGIEKEKHDDTNSISFSSPPDDPRQCPLNFVPTTSADERKSESKEVPESSTKSLIGTLKTPELTPPTVPRPTNRNMEKKSPASSKNISLHTPELSPSLRKIVAMKKAHMSKQASHHNLDTDCSEMSDFIASEVEKYEKKGSPSEQPNKSYQEESLKLVTPQLSKSPVANTKIPSKTTKPARKRVDIEIPELDASTLSGVSTFQDSNYSAPEIQPSLRENEGRIESPKEKVEIPTESPVKDSNDELQQLETPKKEAECVKSSNENSSHQNTYSAVYLSESMSVHDEEADMNVSGETVIDLLSEGEFIGAAYRSPGELSFRQPYRLPRSTITSSEHSPATKPSLEESKDGGESDLSFISSGLQIIGGPERHANFSLGEYLQR